MDVISFAGEGLSPELVPTEELADCAATALEADGERILSYGTGAGYTPLRELIGEWFGVHPYRVLLTNGWLQGFGLIAQDRVRARNVLIEYPSYHPVTKMMFTAGASLLYADLSDEGLDMQTLEYQLRTSQATALAYTIPTFHNPTGQTLSGEQRGAMWMLMRRLNTLVVEDDTFGLLRFEGERLPTLFEFSAQTIIYSTSFTYSIAPGLRVGLFILPDELAGELSTKANDTYITPSLLSQATVFEFLRRESFQAHLDRLRASLKERRDTMISALEQHLPAATWVRPEGGIYLMLQLPHGTNAKESLDRAEDVTALPGLDFGGRANTIRLNFAEPGLDEIEPGIERLARVLAPAFGN